MNMRTHVRTLARRLSTGASPKVQLTAAAAKAAAPRLPQRRLGANGPLVSAVGLGCMPLSLEGRPDAEEAVGVIHAALDAGVSLFDTADVYCTSHDDIGHNERLLRSALDSYRGPADTSCVVIATKGIMARPDGAWEAGSDPDALFAACDRSLEALGVSTLDLYYLHTPSGFAGDDLKFARACRNLQLLQQEGKVRHVGLSNVGYELLVASQGAIEVCAVQNRCNVFDPSAFKDGVVGQCKTSGVAFVPHSPVGGAVPPGPPPGVHAAARPELLPICDRLGCSPQEAMLSWLLQIDDCIIPVVGATRVSTVHSIASCARFEHALRDEEIVGFLK